MNETEKPDGYDYEGIEGYAYPPFVDDYDESLEYITYEVIPLFRYYNELSIDHAYSSDYFEFY